MLNTAALRALAAPAMSSAPVPTGAPSPSIARRATTTGSTPQLLSRGCPSPPKTASSKLVTTHVSSSNSSTSAHAPSVIIARASPVMYTAAAPL